jgi:hypothetical protein
MFCLLNMKGVRKVKNVCAYNPRSCFIVPEQSFGVLVESYLVHMVQRTFDVITSLVSLVYWGFRGEKVTSQGDA